MGLSACHHGDYGGFIPPAAPTFTYHDPFTDTGRRIKARYAAIDALTGGEYAYRRDEDSPHVFKVGFTADVWIDGQPLRLEVKRRWQAIGRLRCEVAFSDGVVVRITQAMLRALLDKFAPSPVRALFVVAQASAPRVRSNYTTLDDCVMVFGRVFGIDDLTGQRLLKRQAAINARRAAKAKPLQDVICLPAISQSMAHERFLAFMERLDRDIPLTEADMAVKLELEPVQKAAKQKTRRVGQNPTPKIKHPHHGGIVERTSVRHVSINGHRVRKVAA